MWLFDFEINLKLLFIHRVFDWQKTEKPNHVRSGFRCLFDVITGVFQAISCDRYCIVNDHPNEATHDRLNEAIQNAQKAVLGSASKYVFTAKNHPPFLIKIDRVKTLKTRNERIFVQT